MYRLLVTTAVATFVLYAPAYANGPHSSGGDPPPPIIVHSTGGAGGAGGTGGSARAGARAGAASNASSTSGAIIGSGAGSATINEGSSNLLAPASFSASGANRWSCPVVGAGVGGANYQSSGLFSYGTTSEWCQTMILTEVAGMTLNATQVELLSDEFPQFKKAWETNHQSAPVQQATAKTVTPVDSGQDIDRCGARPGWTAAEAEANYRKVYGKPCR